jgi:hypothetical protein
MRTALPSAAHGNDATVCDQIVALDVRMPGGSDAVPESVAVGLVARDHDNNPRPVSGRPEIVVRTHPRVVTVVPVGTSVEFEMVPGPPAGPRSGVVSTTVQPPTAPVGGGVTPESPLADTFVHHDAGPASAETRASRMTPAVIGLNVLDASSLILRSGLTIVIRELETGTAARGTVLSQHPAAGERVDPGNLVRVVVAIRPPLVERRSP